MRQGVLPRWLRYVGDAPIALWAGVAFLTYRVLLLLDPQALPHSVATRAIGFTFTAAVCTVALGGALASPNGPLSRWCSWRPLRVVGKYSYALYLWHVTVNAFLYGVGIPRWVDNRTIGDLLYCVVAGAATLGIALVSWFFVEYPASQLKGRFFTPPLTTPHPSPSSHRSGIGGTPATSAPSQSTS